jgi:hypothetical protein
MVAGEAVSAGGTYLGVVLDIHLGGLLGGQGIETGAGRLTM